MSLTFQIIPERAWRDITDPKHWSAIEAEIRNVGKTAVKEGTEAIKRNAIFGIVERRSSWPTLSTMTATIKGKDTPLINHGDLLASIDSVSDGMKGEVGIMRGRGEKNQDLMIVGNVMEYGCTISVTPKMRAWFGAQGYPLRATTTHITIPARPFLEPAEKESYEEIDEQIGKAVDKFFDKVFG